MKAYKLNKNELDIMYVLWESKKPLTAAEIVEGKKGLTTPTVQRLLKKLLENDYVEVAEIVQVGKVLARNYKPKKSMEEYLKEEVEYFFPISKNKGALSHKEYLSSLYPSTSVIYKDKGYFIIECIK